MLRRLLPTLRRGIVSSAAPGATNIHTLPPRCLHRASASHGGAILPCGSIFKGHVAVLPGRPRCPSSLAITSSSSLLPPGGPPRNGSRGFTAMSLSPEFPVIVSTRGDPHMAVHDEANDVHSIDAILPKNQYVKLNSGVWVTSTGKIPQASRKWTSPYKRSFCSKSNADDVIRDGPVLETVPLPTEIDWSRYVHVKKFDCDGQELCTDAIPLKPYVDDNPMTEVRKIYGNRLGNTDPFGNPVKEEDTFVKDTTKKYCKSLIDGMSEFHRAGVCVAKLDHTNIVLAAGATVAKYTDLTFVPASLQMKKKNYLWLKRVLAEDLFQGKPVPRDMQRLFFIMENHSVASVYLMKRYIALVPRVNRSAFFLRLYERLRILKFIDTVEANRILDSLPYRYEWRALMLLNDVLETIFTHGTGYDPKDDPYIFTLCYKHSCYHKCDRCCDTLTKIQLYTA